MILRFYLNLNSVSLSNEAIEKNSPSSKDRTDRKFVVGVCPSAVIANQSHANGRNYVQNIAHLINYLVHKDYLVALYPNATRVNMNKTHNNDLPLLNDIVNNLHQRQKIKF